METSLIKTAGRTVGKKRVRGVRASGTSAIEDAADIVDTRAQCKRSMNTQSGVAGKRESLSRRPLHSPMCQTVAAAMVFCVALVLFHRIVGVDVSTYRLAILAATAAAAFGCLRLLLSVCIGTATVGGLLYLCHPLCATHAFGSSESLTLAPMLLVPLGLLLTGYACRTPGVFSAAGFGVILGVSFAIEPSGGIILAVVMGLYVVFEVVQTPWRRRKRISRGGRRRAAFLVLLVLVVCMFVATALPRIVGHVGPTLPIASSTVPAPQVTAPFALVDRDGLLATRLGALSDDLSAGGGTHYLGWSLLALCLIAVWPARREGGDSHLGHATRRNATLLILAFGLMWLMRGSESLHVQLVRMFEFATVKRYVEPTTLHLLGVLTLPLLLACVVLLLSVGTWLSGRKRWTWFAVFGATTAVITWWALAPTPLLPTSASSSVFAGGSTITAPLVAVLLVCGAAAGLQRIMAGSKTKPRRLAVWLIALAILAADVAPYVERSMNPGVAEPAQASATANPVSAIQTRGGAPKVSLLCRVKGLPTQLGSHPPLFFSTGIIASAKSGVSPQEPSGNLDRRRLILADSCYFDLY